MSVIYVPYYKAAMTMDSKNIYLLDFIFKYSSSHIFNY